MQISPPLAFVLLTIPTPALAAAGALSAPTALDLATTRDSSERWHFDLGFGEGVARDPDTRTSSFSIGVSRRISRAFELTLGTKGLDHGRGTADAARSQANLELGVRWLPGGRPRTRAALATAWGNVQLEAGAGLARASLVPWDDANPFAADERTFGLGFSAGVRWLPMIGDSFAAGLGAWYVGQADGDGRRDAWMGGFIVELGR